jgi:predicted O-linked N-acetylglucosamine transferase (SPINDLY family)
LRFVLLCGLVLLLTISKIMSKIGRNDPCACGSGKKYKQCCLLKQAAPVAASNKKPPSKVDRSTLQEAAEHLQFGRLAQAEMVCRQILQIEPDQPDALQYLGLVAYHVGKNEVAVELIGKAVRLAPTASNCSNLGLAYQALGQLDAAIASYQKALVQQPNHAVAHNNLGNALKDQDKLEAALQHYRKAISYNPNFAEAYNNVGGALKNQGKLDQAADYFQKAISIRPDFSEAYTNLLFLKSFEVSLNSGDYLSLARGWEKTCVPASERQLARTKTFQRQALTGRRLRVGYVSGDYWHHAVSNFIGQIFAQHDRSKVEVFAYAASAKHDAVTDRLRASVEHWVSVVGMPDSVFLAQIEADQIDVLIDLSGHTQYERLKVFARRAAPVQASYLGYFASTGLTEMDYWIGDAVLTPAELDEQFSEQVWRLPRVWVSYHTMADAPKPDWQPAEDGSIWLGSFNNLGKLTPQTIALWANVLHALPEGRLLLKTKLLGDTGNQQRIFEAFGQHGIMPQRIELQGASNWADYMAAYHRLDISLDPVGGHSGGTISCDALWMGVPVIHALGDRATSRFTASILSAIGHAEWVCQSDAEYVQKTVALARDVAQRKTIRYSLREQMASSPLCDAKDLAKNLEEAYFLMFERWMGMS